LNLEPLRLDRSLTSMYFGVAAGSPACPTRVRNASKTFDSSSLSWVAFFSSRSWRRASAAPSTSTCPSRPVKSSRSSPSSPPSSPARGAACPVAGAAAGGEPQLVGVARLVLLPAGQQQPLPGELAEAAKGEVL